MNNQINYQNNYPSAFNPLPNIPFNGNMPKSGFKNHNFINRNDLLDNNLEQIIIKEDIKEYIVSIDSKDRNYHMYPNPFDFTVTFNPLSFKTEIINGKKVKPETPSPVILGSFEDVRYIKLNTVILPLYTSITAVKEEQDLKQCKEIYYLPGKPIPEEKIHHWKVNTDCSLTDYLYTVLFIEGDSNNYFQENQYSTNDVLSQGFSTLYYDSKVNETHYWCDFRSGVKIFPPDKLGNINKLRIRLVNPYGEQICCDHLDKKLNSGLVCRCNNNNINSECFIHNLKHPLNPIFQWHIQLKIGVVSSNINKKNFS